MTTQRESTVAEPGLDLQLVSISAVASMGPRGFALGQGVMWETEIRELMF